MNDRGGLEKSVSRSGGQKAPWSWKNERVNLKIVLLKSEADLYKLDLENLKKRGAMVKIPSDRIFKNPLRKAHNSQKVDLTLKSTPRSKNCLILGLLKISNFD